MKPNKLSLFEEEDVRKGLCGITGKKLPFGSSFQCICSVQCRNRDNSGIVLRKVGIPTLSADLGIVPDNSRIAQGIYILL